jgi:hypothetical protein
MLAENNRPKNDVHCNFSPLLFGFDGTIFRAISHSRGKFKSLLNMTTADCLK